MVRSLPRPVLRQRHIAIEAAWIATHRAPGLMRRFGFEKLQNFDKEKWQALRREAENKSNRPPRPFPAVTTTVI